MTRGQGAEGGFPDRVPDEEEQSSAGGSASSSAERARHRLVQALAAADGRPEELPGALCRIGLEQLPVEGVSVSLSGGHGVDSILWASEGVAERLAEMQATLGDGPCRRALDLTAPVFAPDLTRGPDNHRWPLFAQEAAALGVHAVFSLPLGSETMAMGTLDLYRRAAGPLEKQELRFALLLAEAVTQAILRLPVGDPEAGEDPVAWLHSADNGHEHVHHAVGMIMVHLGVDLQYAFARLRAYAFARGRTVREVSADIVNGEVRIDD